MKIKATYLLFFSLIITSSIIFIFSQQKNIPKKSNKRMPVPTDQSIFDRVQQDDKKQKKQGRKEWLERRHRAADGVDWRKMDRDLRRKKAKARQNSQQSKSVFESLANGHLEGDWQEVGSNNQAGRITYSDFDLTNNMLYSASQGGHIWKSPINGSDWQVLNDNFRIDGMLLLRLLDMGGGAQRILIGADEWATEGIYYSDDDGQNWTQTTGLGNVAAWGTVRQVVVADDAAQTIFLYATAWDYVAWEAITELYRSTDKGASFTKVTQWSEASFGTASRFALWTAYDGSGIVYLLENNNIYQLDAVTGMPILISNFTVSSTIESVTLSGAESGGTTYLYAAIVDAGQSNIYGSNDGGANWNFRGTIGEGYFNKNSINVSSNNPQKLYYGGVDTYRSYNGGTTWTAVNTWGQYYGNPAIYLHADIPSINVLKDASNNEFVLINTDGGVYISTDDLQSVSNLSLNGLRVSQYYSHYTNRNNPNVLYAGSQDQGYQQTTNTTAGVNTNFTQVISGDYAQIVSTNGGEDIWMVYPGFAMFAPNATNVLSGLSYWDFVSDQLWLPPLMAHPTNPNKVYLGGGGEFGGAHIFELTYTGGGNINYSELPYDFETLSGSVNISDMAFSPIDDNYRYILMENGSFFHSTNGGSTWVMSSFSGPTPQYLFGAAIVPSTTQLGDVYIGGSGYSNPPVYQSSDHGASFSPMSTNLPNTMVNDMDISDDGSLLFAGTEVGPYVYAFADNQWYDIHGAFTPDQNYFDVDFVDGNDLVRFASHGRGIWEFKISSPPVTANIKVILEGAYDTNSNLMNTNLLTANNLPMQQPYNVAPWNYAGTESISSFPNTNIVDWVLIEARDASLNVVATRAALLQNNGQVLELDGTNAVVFPTLTNGNSYHLTVRHRNHLAVVSNTAVTLPNVMTYDFTAANTTLGPAQTVNMGGTIHALHAGDFNADGIISVSDFNGYADLLSSPNPYEDADFNLDGAMTVGDFNAYKPNSSVIGVRVVRY